MVDSMLSTEEVIDYLSRNKNLLHENFGVTRIGLFGSFAHKRQTTDSDIDIVVEFEKDKKNIHSFFGLKRFLEAGLGRKVDLGPEHCLKPAVREKNKDRILYV